MPNLVRALRDEADRAEDRGYAMHAFGGHRFFDDRFYRAFNTLVQGTAGVQAKRGLVNVYRECQLNRGELGLMLIIHDELIYESEGDPRTDRRVLELMQETERFKVPIIAEMLGSAKNWQEKTKVKLAA
jgi:DNA polymerase I-like protein with 3'-5' exonuclease and polymerase domains